jgi:hypothetical protein
MHRHPGVARTLEQLTQDYYFLGAKRKVELIVLQCHVYNTTKTTRHKPYRKLQPNSAPARKWQVVIIDFIIKLPPSEDPLTKIKINVILAIVDRLSKYAMFIPYLESTTAEQLADIVIRELVSKFGMPEEFITDRDKLFTSNM